MRIAWPWWSPDRSSSAVKRDAWGISFAENAYALNAASRRSAWQVAFGALLVALAEAVALLALAPLKTVEPVVITVDRTTGEVHRPVHVRDVAEYSPEEAIAKSFLHRFVLRREGFLRARAEADFLYVSLFLTQAMKERWAALYRPENPESPLNLPPGTEVRVDIASISFLQKGVALVRFSRRFITPSAPERIERWTATIVHSFQPAQMREGDLWRNPLGMLVSAYRRDPEVGGQ